MSGRLRNQPQSNTTWLFEILLAHFHEIKKHYIELFSVVFDNGVPSINTDTILSLSPRVKLKNLSLQLIGIAMETNKVAKEQGDMT